MRRFYSPPENFVDGSVWLDIDETRHLRHVLRLKRGDEVSVFDGVGKEFRCEITEITKSVSWLIVAKETVTTSPESPCEITIAPAVLNGDRYDLIIQKAVELGVATLVPLSTIRCDVKPKDAEKRLERWRRIALEATKQCGRAKLMRIAEPVALDKFIETKKGSVVLFSERAGNDFSTITKGEKITALFGPKGGWDDSELDAARLNGVNIVTLGGRILRADTAAIAITAIIQHRFGDIE
ncbi:MAG: 16S rRNA (uracil(1498)-N(3))-methyltransferase [Pyrinomonadaceae bacterium]